MKLILTPFEGRYSGHTDCKDWAIYAAPAWWGFLNVAEKDRIESVINKAKRYGSYVHFQSRLLRHCKACFT